MAVKKAIKLVLCIVVFFVVAYCCFWIYGLFHLDTNIEPWTPNEGVWYCDELKIQLSFTLDEETYAIINGEKVICVWGNNPGTSYLSVHVQENGLEDYALGETIFFGKCSELIDTELIIIDNDTGIPYSFIRMH